MATIAVTIPAGKDPRAVLDRLGKQIRSIAAEVPNSVTGGSTVITFDNAPTSGVVSVQITSGPHSNNSKKGTA